MPFSDSLTTNLSVVGTGPTTNVRAGDDLQAAINAAKPGDVLRIEAGATFTGSFNFPVKSGSGNITLKSSNFNSFGSGRVTPADINKMPRLVNNNPDPVISIPARSHNWIFQGLAIGPTAGIHLNNIVRIGSGSDLTVDLPYGFLFDRCYIYGDPTVGARRGIGLNCNEATVINCWISDIKDRDSDSQAICCWNGRGPFLIDNNHLEGSGENVMFGGDRGPDLNVPANVTFTRNHCYKPLSWITGPWIVKNLFEIKFIDNITIEGNVFENNWAQAQVGFAILIKSTGLGAYSRNIIFRNNIVKNSPGAFNFGYHDNNGEAEDLHDVAIYNNLIQGINSNLSPAQKLLQNVGGLVNFSFYHNTFADDCSPAFHIFMDTVPPKHTNYIYRDNIGIGESKGSGSAEFTDTLNTYCNSPYYIRNNAFIGRSAGLYPVTNYFPANYAAVQFVGGGNYRLLASSPLHNAASDGTDIGANINTVETATSGVVI